MQTITTNNDKHTYTGIPTSKMLLWIGIVSMIMAFAGLTSAYLVRKAEGNWVDFNLPKAFTVSTIILLISSFTMHMAFLAVKKNNFQNAKTYVLATLALGMAFIFSQFYGWNVLVDNGIFFVGNPSGSFLYVLTGLHVGHLVGGIIALIIISAKTIQEKYNSTNYLGMELGTIFWHFLDLLWIYLFVFVGYWA
jgi:cytochrome c oxidase subunit III